MAVALNFVTRAVTITTPRDDLTAIVEAVCRYDEWYPFNRNGPNGRPRFYAAEPSDKGRYLLGVLGSFDSVPEAFQFLMNAFWRSVLQALGAEPVERQPDLLDKLLVTLRKRLRQPTGPLRFESEEELHRLARESLRIARDFRRERRYLRYSQLEAMWRPLVEAFLSENPAPAGQEDDAGHYRDAQRHLAPSIQRLCQAGVLFQGVEWRCETCFNRNWVSIETLAKSVTCEVCGRAEPAPVSGDWYFRLNPFVLDAYRDHGVEPLLWGLWRLWDRARESFYFAPSLNVWLDRPEADLGEHDLEIDGIAVVDGEVYLIEATASPSLDDNEISQIVVAAERVRPNYVLIVCGRSERNDLALGKRLQERLPAGVGVKVRVFDPATLDDSPMLPS